MTCTIKLTNGMMAFVDDDMVDWLRMFTWTAFWNNDMLYAFNEKHRKAMHQFIMPDAKAVDHINQDGLDNRKSNLRETNNRLNTLNHSRPINPERRRHGYVARLGPIYLGTCQSLDAAIRLTELNRRRVLIGEPIVRLSRTRSYSH
jgi:hypothetical protein